MGENASSSDRPASPRPQHEAGQSEPDPSADNGTATSHNKEEGDAALDAGTDAGAEKDDCDNDNNDEVPSRKESSSVSETTAGSASASHHPAMEAPQPRTSPATVAAAASAAAAAASSASPASVRPPILRRPRIGSQSRLPGMAGGAHYPPLGAGASRSGSAPQLRGILRPSSLSDSHLVRADAAAAAATAGATGADAPLANATFDLVQPSAGTTPLGGRHRDSREELRRLMQAPVIDWTAIRQVQARHYSRSRQSQSGSTSAASSATASAPHSRSSLASLSTASASASATGGIGIHNLRGTCSNTEDAVNSGSISDLSGCGLPSAQALLASSHASMSGGSRSSGGGGGMGVGLGGASSRPGRNASWDVVGHHHPPRHIPHAAGGSGGGGGGATAAGGPMAHHRHGLYLAGSASVQRNESFGGGPRPQDQYPRPPQSHQRRRTVADIFAQAAGESRSSAADMFTRLLNAGPCLGSSSLSSSSSSAAGFAAASSGPMGAGSVYSHLLAPPVPRNTGLVPRCGTGTGGSRSIGLSVTAVGGGGVDGIGESYLGRDNSDGGSCSAGSTGLSASDGNESEASAGGRRSAGLVLARRPSSGMKRGGSSGGHSHSRGSGHGLVLAKSHSKQSVTSFGSTDSGGSGPRRGLVLAKSTESLGASRPTPSTITVGGFGLGLGMSRTSGMPGSLGSLGSLSNPSPRAHWGRETGGESDIFAPSAGVKRPRGSGLVLTKDPSSDKKAKTNTSNKEGQDDRPGLSSS